MADAAQGEPIEPEGDAEALVDETLARLFAVVYIESDPFLLTDLAQAARKAGFDESEIARSQTHAKEQFMQGGELHAE